MTANGKGRRAHNPYEKVLALRLPTLLINEIDDFASDEFESRSHATRILLERGLAASGRSVLRPRRVGRIK